MIISDITPTSLTLVFNNPTDREYHYSSHFALYVRKDDTWVLAEPIIENWDWVFTDEGYSILPYSETDAVIIDWRSVLGELPSGEYKFKKEIIYLRKPGDFDKFILEHEFNLQ